MAEPTGAHNTGEISLHQGHAAAFHGDVGARAHGDSHVGLGQGGCIVDSIPSHGHNPALLLQALDDLGFFLGQDLGPEFFDVELTSDGCGGRLAVPGEHHQAQSCRLEIAQSWCCRRLHWVRDPDQGGQAAIECHKDDSLSLATQSLCFVRQPIGAHPQFLEQPFVPDGDRPAFDRAGDAAARENTKLPRLGQSQVPFRGGSQQPSSEGVFTSLF